MFLKMRSKICDCPEDCEYIEYQTSISYAESDLFSNGIENNKMEYIRRLSKTVGI